VNLKASGRRDAKEVFDEVIPAPADQVQIPTLAVIHIRNDVISRDGNANFVKVWKNKHGVGGSISSSRGPKDSDARNVTSMMGYFFAASKFEGRQSNPQRSVVPSLALP
jgi:hypothetical protein